MTVRGAVQSAHRSWSKTWREPGKGSTLSIVRLVGIAIGSFVMASLAASLVLGLLLGPDVVQRPGMAVVNLALGALIYREIVRRERGQTEADGHQ